MLLKTDENLPGEVAEFLREQGFDCRTAHSQGLGGHLIAASAMSAAAKGEFS